jgi:DNA adenine methylase
MEEDKQAGPFLRWAGGKSWFINQISDQLAELEFNDYHEPFLGGGAVFFSISRTGEAYLSDSNESLIETYTCVRDNPELVIRHMRSYENTEDCYYQTRAEKLSGRYQRAAQFIYMNQTSYNGIYRVNLKGEYNVPYGKRSKQFLDKSTILAASKVLQSATLSHGDFHDSLTNIKKGDLVFLDPPYTVSHNKNGFIKYNKSLFSLEDQHRLSNYIQEVKQRGATYILTNAAHCAIEEIFGVEDKPIELKRASLIGGKKAIRGAVSEYLFTNARVNL